MNEPEITAGRTDSRDGIFQAINFSYVLGAVILVSTESAHASSVPDPPNRSTLWTYTEKETSGEEMFSLHSAKKQPDRVDDLVGVRDFGVTDPDVDWAPKPYQKDRRSFVQRDNADKHKTNHNILTPE